MSNTKISELVETTDLTWSYWIPLTQISWNTNTSKKMSSANFKQACIWPAWPAGSQFDCTVATSGWDYTTVWAALAAGKTNIFVKDGLYTEDFWDCTNGKYITITGQSMLGVRITFNNTNTHNSCYIDASNGAALIVSKIKFFLTFTGTNYNFVYTSSSFVGIPFKFSNCYFYYNQGTNSTVGSTRRLVNWTYIDLSYGSWLPITLPRSFENGFFDSYFYTAYDKAGSDYAIRLWDTWLNYFEWCRFTTDTSAGSVNLNWVTVLNRCFLDVFKYSGWGLSINDTTINLKDWGSQADGSWFTNPVINFYEANNSYIKYNTSVAYGTGITLYYNMNNCKFDVLGMNVIVWWAWDVAYMSASMVNCTGNISAAKCIATGNNLVGTNIWIANAQNMVFTGNKVVGIFTSDNISFQTITGNSFLWVVNLASGSDYSTFSWNQVWGALSIVWRYATISGNGISGNVTMSSSTGECVFSGNKCWTITISAGSNYNVITGNQNSTITDWGTGTIKSGNRV